MRPVARFVLVVGLCAASPRAAFADDDHDLDRIPSEALTRPNEAERVPTDPEAGAQRGPVKAKVFAADAFTASSPPEPVPVPLPSGRVVDWQNRTSLDASFQWRPLKPLAFSLSDRLNVFERNDVAVLSRSTMENDLRELFVSGEVWASTFVEAGRMNVRNGVALGFNPTDFFKTRTLVGQASLDPSVVRENRLGTLMVRGQTTWNRGSMSLAFAPKVADPAPLSGAHRAPLDPHFDATNGSDRLLATLSLDVANLSPEFFGYLEHHRSKAGLSASYPIGQAIVAYAEWTGGREASLATRAHSLGRATGELPDTAPVLPPTHQSSRFRSDVAAGLSLTVVTRVTVNVEYLLHESGFGRNDWRHWFDIGSAPGASSAPASALWYVRGYAQDQQEPISKQQLFVRADWPKVFGTDMELTGFAVVSLVDGSALTQVSVSHYLSDAWTIAGYASANIGSTRSEHGSVPQRGSGILEITRYF